MKRRLAELSADCVFFSFGAMTYGPSVWRWILLLSLVSWLALTSLEVYEDSRRTRSTARIDDL